MSSKNVALGEVCIVKRGTTITQKEAIEGEIPVVAGGLKPTYYHNQANRLGNTITISGSGANAGFVNFWNQPIFASDCSTVEVINNKLDITYVYYFLLSKQQYIYNELRSGAAQPHVYGKDIAKIVISIPSVATQQKIVAKLDAIFAEIDVATAAAEANAKNAEALFQSYLTEFFELETKNNTSLLGEVCNVIGGGTPSKANEEFYTGTIPWATVRDMNKDNLDITDYKITEEAVRLSATNIIPSNNVVIATRVGLGKVCILNQDTAINQDLRGVIPKSKDILDVNYLFLWFKFIAEKIIQAGRGATVQGVTLPFIKSLAIPVPSLIKQKNIVVKIQLIFNNTELAKNSYVTKINELDVLKQSILQRAFSGELVKD